MGCSASLTTEYDKYHSSEGDNSGDSGIRGDSSDVSREFIEEMPGTGNKKEDKNDIEEKNKNDDNTKHENGVDGKLGNDFDSRFESNIKQEQGIDIKNGYESNISKKPEDGISNKFESNIKEEQGNDIKNGYESNISRIPEDGISSKFGSNISKKPEDGIDNRFDSNIKKKQGNDVKKKSKDDANEGRENGTKESFEDGSEGNSEEDTGESLEEDTGESLEGGTGEITEEYSTRTPASEIQKKVYAKNNIGKSNAYWPKLFSYLIDFSKANIQPVCEIIESANIQQTVAIVDMLNVCSFRKPFFNTYYAYFIHQINQKSDVGSFKFEAELNKPLMYHIFARGGNLKFDYIKNFALFCTDMGRIQKQSDYKLVREIYENTFPLGSVGLIIRGDSVEQLRAYLKKHNEIDINSKHQPYYPGVTDINSSTIITDYHQLHDNIFRECSLLALSAYFGAKRCFNYLLNKGAIIDEETVKFSIMSGEMTIFEKVEEIKGNDLLKHAMLAMKFYQKDILKRIIDRPGIDIKILSDLGTASIKYNNIPFMLRYLANANHGNIDKLDSDDLSVLHYAVAKNNILAVELLLSKGANVNIRGVDGKTPLIISCENGNKDIYDLLIKNHAKIHYETEGKFNALHSAAAGGHKLIVQSLVEMGVKVNSVSLNGETPLYHAVYFNHIDVVVYLLKKGANPNIKTTHSKTCLMVACQFEFTEIAEILLNHGASVHTADKIRNTCLHYAATTGNVKMVTILSRKFDDRLLNHVGAERRTALHYSSERGHDKIVQILLRCGASRNAKDKFGMTPLHYAAMLGHENVCKNLVDSGAKVDTHDSKDKTPLIYSVQYERRAVAQLLCSCGADVNAYDSHDMTPLHYAAQNGNDKIAHMLIQRKAIINKHDSKGRTPAMIARMKGCTKVLNMLTAHGGTF